MEQNPFLESLSAVEEEIQKRLARKSLLEYECYVNPTYVKSKFHTFLCNKVQEFMEKKTSNGFDILLLSVPPQHGKSVSITETLPAWYLGKYPDKKWILCSYNTDFASSFGRKNRQKCEEYNTKLFPNFKLADYPCNNIEFETTEKGGLYSAGILAGVTGHTADFFIVDDPIKTRQEAESETTKAAIWGEYLSSIRTRIKPGGKLIVIQTRWAPDDLYGRILEAEKNVTVINIPCECDDEENDLLGRKLGDALCPEIGRGNAWLRDFKEVYKDKEGSRAWTSLYQGKPVAMEGNLIKREWWKYYNDSWTELKLPYIILSVDAAFKDGDDNDFVAIQVWGKKDKEYYLLDALKQHLNFVDTLAAIRNFKAKYEDMMFILIEDKANGTAIINVLSAEMEGVIPVKPEGGKVTRANAVSPAIESGHVHLPRFASFVDDFVAECSAFPNGAHDDQVDAMTQALNRMIFVDADVVAPQHIKYTMYSDDMLQDLTNADDELRAFLLEKWGFPLQWEDDVDNE